MNESASDIQKLPNLRKRIILGLLLYTVMLTCAVGLHGFIVNENIEKLVWENILNIDIDHFNHQYVHHKNEPSNLYIYDESQGDEIPKDFRKYELGIHDEIEYQQRIYVIRVVQEKPYKQIIALDITEIERQEGNIILSILLLTLVAISLMAWIAYLHLGKLINPLLLLANDLSRISTIKHPFDVEIKPMQYHESYILSDAIQRYVERSQHYLEKEKVFFSTASHELRTPISVISGAIEVLRHHPSVHPSLMPHLERITRITNDIEELIACLLFLSRDQQRLDRYAEQIDLLNVMPTIIEDHLPLCESKHIQITNFIQDSFKIHAPPQLIKVVIGNLLRNAIENCDDGTIKITQNHFKIMIEDSGHGMSAEELSAFYTRRARLGQHTRAGIGIPLILKICDHFGWQLSFESKPDKGTIAILKFK